ncbi:DNA methyltransferase [Rhodococcus opacus]|uniref:Eco57I restriction-modification methylase domain-containing protein n=1 Tax=Rhodococcus opacus TaxID=37919 RepID=UPI0007CD8BD3|nr:DNA methyltransferase [Rhodococcus opacus]MDX5962286.1 DNA methyltransferase [Rhodococcus opacus]NKY74822.1 N-6 DNA methylase [Rhodococcus opacus]CAG7641718.1 hypothetical protein E143388_08312 [Rhodococcus opacus]
MSTESTFVGVRIQGGLIPADLLARLSTGTDLDGDSLTSTDYHLAAGESVRDAANRVWAYLRGAWVNYRDALNKLPDTDRATTLTRERFTLPLFDQLGYGRIPTTPAGGLSVEGHPFAISHSWQNVPIHLLGARIELDRRTPGVAGASGASPQSMVQELLNRSDQHLWAILSNGNVLRLLRDSTSLVGASYVEFDLEAIFDGDLFSDFLLLFTLCHQSRLEVRDPQIGTASCWLEQWRLTSVASGSRALNLLRDGVVQALQTLGTGFLGHPDNAALRGDLADGTVTVSDVHHGLLRVVYRLLFTFVAEDRGALLDPHADPQTRQRYLTYFSTARLRAVARRRSGGRHSDKWEAQALVWRGLGSETGLPALGLPGIGGLFEPGELDFLLDQSLSNRDLLAAVRSLSQMREPGSGIRRIVDYRNLGAEELGSIYESLLEFVPSWNPATKNYELGISSGNQRKDTGSYYTPTSLVESLLDTALDPVLDEASKAADPEAALLQVTVCDPACGSGHFLVGAARRIAKRVAAVRTGDPEPPPEQVRSAMLDVVAHCVYGVDVNPLAAELAKVSLWLEALEPGRPLAFLDAQVKVGNALIGATPAVLADGIPDEAFKPIEGDDKKFAASLAKQNKAERNDQGSLFEREELTATNHALAEDLGQVVGGQSLSLSDVHVQRQRLRAYTESHAYRHQRLVADTWCAAFVWPKTPDAPPPITHRTLTELAERPEILSHQQREQVEQLAGEYRFFHWHLEFPHLFPTSPDGDDTVNPTTGWAGGFTVIIGNPPWERVKLQELEFFAARDPHVATAPNAAARKRMITTLIETNPRLHEEFLAARRQAEGVSHLLRNSGRYPLTGRGDINTYAVFAEADRNLLAGRGRLGVILPTGIATDATTQHFFKDLVIRGSIAGLYDFENRKPLFVGVHNNFKFCLLTLTGRDLRESAADFAFYATEPSDLQRPDVRFALTPEEITLLNPNTGTCPIFRSRRDAEITLGIYKRVPVLIRDDDPRGNPWDVKLTTMFHMSNDSDLFHTRVELESDDWILKGNVFSRKNERMLPLYEGRMIHQFNSKWATHDTDGSIHELSEEESRDPEVMPIPRYWVRETDVNSKLGKWTKNERLLGYRVITNTTNERTMISCIFPRSAASNMFAIAFVPQDAEVLSAVWNSFVFDYVARQKLGNPAMNFFVLKQLPTIPVTSLADKKEYIINLSRYLADEKTDNANREIARAWVDAAFFHLYGVARDDVDYIMETFSIVKRRDFAAHGEYRTKRMILEIYDAVAEAERTGVTYQSPFDTVSGEV